MSYDLTYKQTNEHQREIIIIYIDVENQESENYSFNDSPFTRCHVLFTRIPFNPSMDIARFAWRVTQNYAFKFIPINKRNFKIQSPNQAKFQNSVPYTSEISKFSPLNKRNFKIQSLNRQNFKIQSPKQANFQKSHINVNQTISSEINDKINTQLYLIIIVSFLS